MQVKFKILLPVNKQESVAEAANHTTKYANGDSYTGAIANNLRNGQGVYTFKGGDVYEGNFVNSHFEGKGSYTSEGGDLYEGNFLDSTATGQGTATYMSIPNFQSYEGFWTANLASNKGKLTFDMGDYYEGTFENGLMHGRGVMYYANGDAYDGTYVNGNPQGDGQFLFKESNTIMKRKFQNGVDRATTSDLKSNTFEIKKKQNAHIERVDLKPSNGKPTIFAKPAKKITNGGLIAGLLGNKGKSAGATKRAAPAKKAAGTGKKVAVKKIAAKIKTQKKVKAVKALKKKVRRTGAARKPTVWSDYSISYPKSKPAAPVDYTKIFNEIEEETKGVQRSKSIQFTLDSARAFFLNKERSRNETK